MIARRSKSLPKCRPVDPRRSARIKSAAHYYRRFVVNAGNWSSSVVATAEALGDATNLSPDKAFDVALRLCVDIPWTWFREDPISSAFRRTEDFGSTDWGCSPKKSSRGSED
jgi:hypothetical protein